MLFLTRTRLPALIAVMFTALWVQTICATEPYQYAVQVSATVQKSPPQIQLSWPADGASSYSVSRKAVTDGGFGGIATLSGSATGYTDTNVSVGSTYEYQITKNGGWTGYGFIVAGIEAPLTEGRGKVILLVDSSMSSSLSSELTRLENDLIGDGWTVLRRDISRTASVASVRAIIQSDYNSDPSNVKSVFLFGRIPVPYSGDLTPDGHANHIGAWPADVYYADVNGSWSDSSVNDTSAPRQENKNTPGDGKFDPSYLPSDVELQIGRVDLSNMPAFGKSETELLRQYLNKDHNFRHNLISAQRKALVDDNFGNYNNEAFAANGWRNFAPMFGASNVQALDYMGTLSGTAYLWAYGTGGGDYTSEAGVGSTSDFASRNPQAVFNMHFGSYFGDWNSTDNLLRAPLGTATHGLTSAWAARPNWFFHPMGLGYTIGYCTKITQNNNGLYPANRHGRGVHVALMGDPTLRLHVVPPPSGLSAGTSGGISLSWGGSSGAAGYHVYRATSTNGPFSRISGSLIGGTSFTDSSASSGVTYTYMVRAVKLEVAGSGSYFNASQGIFINASTSGSTPTLPGVPANLAATPGNAQVSLTWSASSGAASYNVKRSNTNGSGYTTITSGVGSTSYTNTGLTNGTAYFYVVSAVNSAGESANSGQASAVPNGTPPPSTLPSPWQSGDVGSVGVAGSADYANGVFTVKGSGSDIWFTADGFRFVYQPLNGDGTIVARVSGVQNTDPWAKAGVMIRESLTTGSTNAFMMATSGNGSQYTYRNASNANAISVTGPTGSAPKWVKLTRSGGTFSGYQSSDGSTWTLVSTQSISMAGSVYIGLAVTSHQNAVLNTSTCDNVTVSTGSTPPPPPPPPPPSALPTPWQTGDVGSVGVAGSAGYASGVFSVNGSGSDIWFSADGFRFVYQPLNGDGTIVARVTGLQNTDPWAKAGVMIRESLSTGSTNAYMMVTSGNGSLYTYRNASNANAISVTGPSGSAPKWVKLTRSGSTFSGYQSSDGSAWSLVSTQSISMASSVYIGMAVTSHQNAVLNTSTYDNVTVTTGSTPPPSALPTPWQTSDVGSVGVAGNAGFASGVFTLNGSGSDIWFASDAFRYAYQTMTGDGTIVARVTGVQNTDGWAKGGVMIRQSLNADSSFSLMALTSGNGMAFQNRSSAGAQATHVYGTTTGAPYWVKLTRSGNTLNGYQSSTGSSWTLVGSQTISMSGTVYIGLALTSHLNSVLCKATFDNVTVTLGVAAIEVASRQTEQPAVEATTVDLSSIQATPTPASAGASVSFSASMGGDLSGLTYSWNFGDGASATTLNAGHTYNASGIYLVSLTINGSSGFTASKTISLTVSDAEDAVRPPAPLQE